MKEAFEKVSIQDFNYNLPEEKIARFPLPERDTSKLLLYKNETVTEGLFLNLPAYLPSNSFLVFNNTKVIHARLLFQKPSGGEIEIFCLEPLTTSSLEESLEKTNSTVWKCLVGGAKKWKDACLKKNITIRGQSIELTAQKTGREHDVFYIQFSWNNTAISFADILHQAGKIPLPPYLKRLSQKEDEQTYQTLYAQKEGSVAAPTAGLHFTPRVWQALQQKNISYGFVTLHVSAGTFKPVKAAFIAQHEMHAEEICIERSFIEQFLQTKNAYVVAVGTTSLRTLESLYWLGIKLLHHPNLAAENLMLHQWEAYEIKDSHISAIEAFTALLQWMNKYNMKKFITKTQLIIVPGYVFKVVQGLVTNFHQPQSTLLLLVAAIIGSEWKRMYEYALQHNFRFLSYGDASLILT